MRLWTNDEKEWKRKENQNKKDSLQHLLKTKEKLTSKPPEDFYLVSAGKQMLQVAGSTPGS